MLFRRMPTVARLATVTAVATVVGLALTLSAPVPSQGILPSSATADCDPPTPPNFDEYYSIFSRGQADMPHLDPKPYVPQGLTYLPELDAMAVSYYNDDERSPSWIAILDRVTSRHLKSLKLDEAGHVGGLATSGRHLWVASTGFDDKKRLIGYALSDITQAANNTELTRREGWEVPASSFVEVSGNKLYLGHFENGKAGRLHSYTLDANDIPQNDYNSWDIPSNVQGMAAVPGGNVWSRSFNRFCPSELGLDLVNGGMVRRVVAPNMSEDLAVANGELYVIYESGARKYSDATVRERTVHHLNLGALLDGAIGGGGASRGR
jgi:hypothetical protein